MLTADKYASGTEPRMESRVRGNVQARFGEGCDPFSRNLELSKGMRGKGRRGL
jgi:hypothetical protein